MKKYRYQARISDNEYKLIRFKAQKGIFTHSYERIQDGQLVVFTFNNKKLLSELASTLRLIPQKAAERFNIPEWMTK